MGDMHPGIRVPSKSPTVVQQIARVVVVRHPPDDGDGEVLRCSVVALRKRAGAGTKAVLEATQVILTIWGDSACRDEETGEQTADITGRESTVPGPAPCSPFSSRSERLHFSDKGAVWISSVSIPYSGGSHLYSRNTAARFVLRRISGGGSRN